MPLVPRAGRDEHWLGCLGHPIDHASGRYCCYGDLHDSEPPAGMSRRRLRKGFGTPEREHIRRWFELWGNAMGL